MKHLLLLLALLPLTAFGMKKEKQEIKSIQPLALVSEWSNVQWLEKMDAAIENEKVNELKTLLAQPIAKTPIWTHINGNPSSIALINYCLLIWPLWRIKNNNIRQTIFDTADEFNICDSCGATPLYLACHHSNDPKLINFLIKKRCAINGCAVSDPSKFGTPAPLHAAQSPEIIDLLINAGANLELKDSDSYTPLLRNAHHFRNEPREEKHLYYKNMVALIAHGADVNAISCWRKNSLKTLLDEDTFNKLLHDAQIAP